METVTDGQLGHRIWGAHPEMGRQVGPPPPHIPLGGFCSSYPTGACSRHTPWVPRTYLVFPPACPERSTTPGLAVGWQEGAGPPPPHKHTQPPVPLFRPLPPVHEKGSASAARMHSGALWNALVKASAGTPKSMEPRWQISDPDPLAHGTSGTTNDGALRTIGTPGAQRVIYALILF